MGKPQQMSSSAFHSSMVSCKYEQGTDLFTTGREAHVVEKMHGSKDPLCACPRITGKQKKATVFACLRHCRFATDPYTVFTCLRHCRLVVAPIYSICTFAALQPCCNQHIHANYCSYMHVQPSISTYTFAGILYNEMHTTYIQIRHGHMTFSRL